jgi:hypothetical protein
MNFQWLEMRISEEKDRRQKEAALLARLPRALEELNRDLSACVEAYQQAFGNESADILAMAHKIKVTVRDHKDGKWQQTGKVEITVNPSVPGFQVDRGAPEPSMVEVGLLPDDKVFYRDRDQDKYLTVEELTRRILDRSLFPKLAE